MSVIRNLYWSNISPAAAPRWVEASGLLLALWPSPVNADACFAEAGFSEFDDPDESWDLQWKGIVERLLNALQRFGPVTLRNRDQVNKYVAKGWLDWITFSQPLQTIVLPPADRIVLSTEDDDFPDAVVDFGDPPAATLRSGMGHPILWTALKPGLPLSGKSLAQDIAGGLPVSERDLKWQYLVGGEG